MPSALSIGTQKWLRKRLSSAQDSPCVGSTKTVCESLGSAWLMASPATSPNFAFGVCSFCLSNASRARLIGLRIMADARNEWIRSTSQLVNKEVEAMAQLDADETAAFDIRAGAGEEGDAA